MVCMTEAELFFLVALIVLISAAWTATTLYYWRKYQ